MKRDPWPWIILGAGFAVFLVYAWPGYMSIDSAVQLLEAREHKYTDWHPPVMAWLWGILDRIVSGPGLMLLAQGSAFVAGLYLVLSRTFRPRSAAVITILVFLFPPVLAPMAVIWKDSQMAGYLLLGTSLLFAERRWPRIVGIALITLACAIRYNAPAATLPLILFLFEWHTGQRWLVRMAIAAAVWVASTAFATAANKHLTDQKSYTWHAAIAPYDIAGILANTHAYHDTVLAEILDGTPIQIHDHFELTARRLYSPVMWWGVTNGEGRMFNWPDNQAHRDALERAWWRLVRDNKWPYVHHRLRVFYAILGLPDGPLFAPLWTGAPTAYADALHMTFEQRPVQKPMAAALTWLATDTGLFRPYIYFFIALLLLPMTWRYRDLRAYLASGLLYELGFLPFGAPDVRYSHWMTVMTITAAIILFHRRRKTS